MWVEPYFFDKRIKLASSDWEREKMPLVDCGKR